MTVSPSPDPLVVRGPDTLPTVVPHLLGFVPSASLVLVGLAGPAHRVLITLRCDLPPLAEPLAGVLESLRPSLSALARAGADAALLVLYPPADEDPWAGPQPRDLPRRALVDTVGTALAVEGVELRDAVCVGGDRLRSYLCEVESCCPPEGRLVDPGEALRIQAAMVAAGSAPMSSREQLVAWVAPLDRDDDRCAALARACAGLGSDRLTVDEVDAFVAACLVDDEGADPDRLTALAALAVLACRWIRSRDLLLRTLAVDLGAEGRARLRTVLAEAVRCVDPGQVAPVASVLAVAAWLSGDGALARVALDRAFGADPAYSLAVLVDAALDHGTPPWEWIELMRELPVRAILQATAGEGPPGPDADLLHELELAGGLDLVDLDAWADDDEDDVWPEDDVDDWTDGPDVPAGDAGPAATAADPEAPAQPAPPGRSADPAGPTGCDPWDARG